MGLSSSMSKIIGVTSKIANFANQASNPNVNIPASSFMRILGIEEDLSFGSLGDTASSITQLKEAVATGVNAIRCGWHIMSDRKGFQDFLSSMVTGAVGVMSYVADQVMDAVTVQISNAVKQIVGTVFNLISALQNLVASVLLIFDAIVDFIKNLSDFADLTFELELEKEACVQFYSSIAACLLNKFLGPYINEFATKLVGKINEFGNNFNEMLYEGLQDVDTFASYANQEAFLLKKASLQMQGLRPSTLLA